MQGDGDNFWAPRILYYACWCTCMSCSCQGTNSNWRSPVSYAACNFLPLSFQELTSTLPMVQQKHMELFCYFCVDLPAQAKLLNMKQYNGKFGCATCEDEGVPRPGAYMQRNWPCTTNRALRTHTSIKHCAGRTGKVASCVQWVWCCLLPEVLP